MKEDFTVISPVVGSKYASISAELPLVLTATGWLMSFTPCFQYRLTEGEKKTNKINDENSTRVLDVWSCNMNLETEIYRMRLVKLQLMDGCKPGPVNRTMDSLSSNTQSIQSANPWQVPGLENSICEKTCKIQWARKVELSFARQLIWLLVKKETSGKKCCIEKMYTNFDSAVISLASSAEDWVAFSK